MNAMNVIPVHPVPALGPRPVPRLVRDIYWIDPKTIGDDTPLQRKLPIRPWRPSVFERFRIAVERCRD